jgi:hypothetical protein
VLTILNLFLYTSKVVDPYHYYGDVVVRFLSVLVVLVSFLLSATVDAQVLCATKTGLVNLRTACKTREKVVDLASLGPTGPQGPKGDAGATGPQGAAGANGGALTAYDDRGNKLGNMISGNLDSILIYDETLGRVYDIHPSDGFGYEINRYYSRNYGYSDDNCSSSPMVVFSDSAVWNSQAREIQPTTVYPSEYPTQPYDLSGSTLFKSAYSEIDITGGRSGRVITLGSLVDSSRNSSDVPVISSGVLVKSIPGIIERFGYERYYNYHQSGSSTISQGRYWVYSYSIPYPSAKGCTTLNPTVPPVMPTPPVEIGGCSGNPPICNYTYTYGGITSDAVTAFNSYAADLEVYNRDSALHQLYVDSNYIRPKGNRWLFNIETTQTPFALPIQGPITLR